MWRLLWGLSVVVILLVGMLPLRNFVGHSHWQYIHWVPEPEQWLTLDLIGDVTGNVLLFVPFGFTYAASSSRPRVWRAALLAAMLSLGVELYQVYCHSRFPTPLDVATNVLGSIVGATAGRRVFRERE